MAEIYKECDGNDTRDVTITISEGSTQTRSYETTECSYYEEYKIVTFSCNPSPINDLVINFSYESATTYNTSDEPDPDDYITINQTIILPALQPSVDFTLITRREICCTGEDSGGGHVDPIY